MEHRTDRLTAAYVDMAVNVAIAFWLDAGVRILHEQKAPPPVVQRVLFNSGPRRSLVVDRSISPHGAPWLAPTH